MARSSVGLQKAIQTGGRDAGVAYCKEWQKELAAEGNSLMVQFKAGKLDTRAYNIKRAELNKQTQELNSCVATLSKKA
ncbi:MAG: hypothetical protein LBH95_00090 [Oscillospiraceae bacterium]|jgi:hypothetical protein|nr:hypothetical protein [Oscillospiraceae bacterium]